MKIFSTNLKLCADIAARVQLLQVSGVEVESNGVAVSKLSTTSLTCDNTTLAAKTLFFDTLFNLSF